MRIFFQIVSWSFLVLLGSCVILIALFWAPDRSVDSLSERWAKAPSQFIQIDGLTLHLRDEGPKSDPNPIILLHGTSASLHTWDGWVNELKNERRVIRFDLPGFGLTGPSTNGDYSIEFYSDIVVGLMEKLQIKQYSIVGNSLGGYIAWVTAIKQPDKVKQLVLIDASGYPYKSESVPIAFKIASIPVLKSLMKYLLPLFVVEDSLKNVYGDSNKVTPELVERYAELATRAGNRQALVARFIQTQPGALAKSIIMVRQPTLILWGGRDKLIPVSIGQRFEQDISDSQLVVFDELGHVPQEEAPVRTVSAFKAFILDLQRREKYKTE